ncbi:n1-acetylpolyamine oxidase [Colletotrichum graminicola]|nr:n1-acetylpolyamine oxidase [Colletotrichum graminicola]
MRQNLPFHPFSASVSISADQIALNRPRVPRPESQEDWDAKKMPSNDFTSIKTSHSRK